MRIIVIDHRGEGRGCFMDGAQLHEALSMIHDLAPVRWDEACSVLPENTDTLLIGLWTAAHHDHLPTGRAHGVLLAENGCVTIQQWLFSHELRWIAW